MSAGREVQVARAWSAVSLIEDNRREPKGERWQALGEGPRRE
jgi:hypothetical protein